MQRCLLVSLSPCLLVFFGAVAGCQLPSQNKAMGPSPLARQVAADIRPRETTDQKDQKELPPDEAAKVSFATAEALDKAGKNKEAIALYEQARKLDSSRYKHVCRRLGVLHDREGNYAQAQREYAIALQQSPKDANLLNDIGYSHYCQGKWEEAETALRKALTLDPKMQRAWVNLGMAQAQQQKYDEAMESWGRVINSAEAHCNLGFILTTQGRRDDAKEAYRRAVAMDANLQVAKTALYKLENPGQPKQDAEAEAPKQKGPRTDRVYVRPQDLFTRQSPPALPTMQGAAPTPQTLPVGSIPSLAPVPQQNAPPATPLQ